MSYCKKHKRQIDRRRCPQCQSEEKEARRSLAVECRDLFCDPDRDYNDPFKIMQYLGDCKEREIFLGFMKQWPKAHYYLTVDMDEIVFEGGEVGDLLITITFDAR